MTPSGTPAAEGTYERTKDAHGGRFAERLTLDRILTTSHTDFRFQSRLDEGGCAPRVLAGHRYVVGAWVKGDVPVHLFVSYRTSDGRWRSGLGSGPAIPTSSRWKLAEWTTAQLPDDASNISVRVLIDSVGSITVDDLFIRDASP